MSDPVQERIKLLRRENEQLSQSIADMRRAVQEKDARIVELETTLAQLKEDAQHSAWERDDME